MKIVLKTLLIIISVIVIGFVALFIYFNFFEKPDFIDQDSTVEWFTYRNEELGFEFKYPKDKSIEVPSFTSSILIKVMGEEEEFHIRNIDQINEDMSPLEWINSKPWAPRTEDDLIYIGDIPAITSNVNYEKEYPNSNMILIDFIAKNNVWEIEWYSGEDLPDELTINDYWDFVNILKTFKFID